MWNILEANKKKRSKKSAHFSPLGKSPKTQNFLKSVFSIEANYVVDETEINPVKFIIKLFITQRLHEGGFPSSEKCYYFLESLYTSKVDRVFELEKRMRGYTQEKV